ncbi:MAG: VOC family protein [Alphaproteobacteria bacterium]|nr:VOC family protein [Alphaproteobacteria bacterium]
MNPRINLVTLGVIDMARARAFYERLGLQASSASNRHVTFFDANGVVLGLFGHEALAEDAHLETSGAPGFRGVSLAWNAESEAAVDAIMDHAEAAGARIVKPAQSVFWGGYSGYFADPDGHLWEVAHNPFFPLDDTGHIQLP